MIAKILGWVAKLGLPLVTGFGSTLIRGLLATALVGLGGFAWLKVHDAKIRAEAMAQCPPQSVYTGNPIVNNYPPNKMTCLPLPLGKRWGFGLCHN